MTGKKLSGPHFSDEEFVKAYAEEYKNNGCIRDLSDRMNWQFTAIKRRFEKLAKITPALRGCVLPLHKKEQKAQRRQREIDARKAADEAAATQLLSLLTATEG